MTKEIKQQKFSREAHFDRASADADKRTIELAFSSELPYRRWFGDEILSHKANAMNMTRIGSGRANMLVNHDPNDWVGVIEQARIDGDSKGRAVVRFGNSARAQEIYADVRDGILSSVSVGYSIDEYEISRKGKGDDPDEYTVTRWTPFEISLVTVPADETVGIGRSAELIKAEPATTKEPIMAEATNAPAGATADNTVTAQPGAGSVMITEDRTNALELHKARIRAIENLCRANKIDDKIREHWIGAGLSLEQVSDDLLRIMQDRSERNPQPATKLGLSAQETQRFSLQRALLAVMDKDWTNAGFELECSRAVAQKLGKPVNPTSFFVPFEVQQRQIVKRDLTVASASGGGYLVETENVGFIELLRNRAVSFNMGVGRLSGLQGSVTVPKQTAGATAYWLANEGTQITEGNQTFGQMALNPKTVGAYTEISRQLLLQSSPDAEGVVTADLAAQVALAVDLAVLNGSGSGGQPTGIIGTGGIGATTATSVDYGKVLDFQTDVAAANIMPMTGGYVTTSAVAKILMTKQRFSSTDTPLWQGNMWDGQMAGFRAMSSEQIPAGYMIFGDWSKVVVGEWGVLEVNVNPFANFQAGIIGVRAIYSMDVGVRYAGAFSVSTSVTA
jgi:HK97 family phage major capsid protein/HK97 family phage prohead protease